MRQHAKKAVKPHRKKEVEPVIPIEEAFSTCVPQTEQEWLEVSKQKKRDLNDVAAEGLDVKEELKKSKRVVLHRTDTPIVSAKEIMQCYPDLRKEVIEGLLRHGEIMNIVGAPKTNKSWSSLNIACNVISGGMFLGKFQCQRGKVLVVDNELHEETISWRIKAVAKALNIPIERAGKLIDYWPLRGELQDIYSLEETLLQIRPREYKIVIFDALYKFYPDGFDENSNADFGQLYNQLDYYARCLDSAVIVIHHSAKGSGAGKSVTDMGAGAGAQTRACDSHLVFREHEDRGIFVCDAANRSFAPIQPFCVEFKFPIWQLNTSADPSMLRGAEGSDGGKKRKGDGKPYSKDAIAGGAQGVVDDVRDKELLTVLAQVTRPMTVNEITALGVGKFADWNRDTCKREIRRFEGLGRMRACANSRGAKGAMYLYVAPVSAAPVAATASNTKNTPSDAGFAENAVQSGEIILPDGWDMSEKATHEAYYGPADVTGDSDNADS